MISPARDPLFPAPYDASPIPEYSTGRILALVDIESPLLRGVAEHWGQLRGARKFPARAEIAPRNLKTVLRHLMLLKVLDDDYEFRIVGDVQVQAYGESFLNLRLSQVARRHAKFAEGVKLFYDATRTGREPFAYRGWIGRDMPDTKFSYHELAFFPLGPDDDTVDHILVAGVYVVRSAWPQT